MDSRTTTRRNGVRVSMEKNRVHVVMFLGFSIFLPVVFGSGYQPPFRGREILEVVPLPAPISPPPPPPPPPPPSNSDSSGSGAGVVPPASPPVYQDITPPPSSQPDVALAPLPPTSQMSPPVSVIPPPALEIPPASPPIGDTWNESEKAGVVIASIAALLQVAVVAFLLIKRHQMLTTVEYDDLIDDLEYDHPRDQNFRHSESV